METPETKGSSLDQSKISQAEADIRVFCLKLAAEVAKCPHGSEDMLLINATEFKDFLYGKDFPEQTVEVDGETVVRMEDYLNK